MDLREMTLTDVTVAITIYSEKGKHDKMTDRATYGLSFCREGRITYIQNGREFVSERGSAVLLPKGGCYTVRRDATGVFTVINFDCAEFLTDTVTVIPVSNADELIADFERMKKLFCFEGNRAQIFSIFYGMLHKLASDGTPQVLETAVRLIRSEWCDPNLTNASLAARCNMSEVYLRKLFSRYLGTSPKQYIIDMRIQRAKQLLSEGALSVSRVSEECGFSNPYHFARLFKEHSGVTPTEYRRANLLYKI